MSFLIKKVFAGWTGDYADTKPAGILVMDGPKVVTVLWKTDTTLLYLFTVVLAITAVVVLTLRRPRVKGTTSL